MTKILHKMPKKKGRSDEEREIVKIVFRHKLNNKN
jgi:hypothetical protein